MICIINESQYIYSQWDKHSSYFKPQQIEYDKWHKRIFFLTVPRNSFLNMGFLYYCLFSVFMITPSVIFLVWYPLRDQASNFGTGHKSPLNIPVIKISFAKVAHTLYFQQKMYRTFPWITEVSHLKDISPSFWRYSAGWSRVYKIYIIKFNTAETVFEVNLQGTYF